MKSKWLNLSLCACLVVAGPGRLCAASGEDVDRALQILKEKVQALEKNVFPPEKSDEIKKVIEYVCPNGHAYTSPPKDMACPEDGLKVRERSALIKVKLDRREEVGERISSLLEEEMKKRVHLAVAATGILQHVADSLEPSTKKQTFAQGSVNVYLLSRPMRNSFFFMDLEGQGGQGPDAAIPNNSVLNNDATSLPQATQQDSVRVREAWFEKTFLVGRLRMAAGKVDLTNYFDRNRAANDETSQFVTGTLVNNPLLGNPANGPGAIAHYDSRRNFSVGIGAAGADSSGVNVTEEPYCIAEADFRFRFLRGQLGNLRFWGSRNGRVSGERRDDYALGVSADQELGSRVVAFARLGRSFKKAAVRDPHAWSAGVLLHDFIPERRRDKVGAGYSRYLTLPGENLSGETDSVGELFYSIFVTDHLAVAPLAQYVFHSAGTSSSSAQSNVFILGLRTQIYF